MSALCHICGLTSWNQRVMRRGSNRAIVHVANTAMYAPPVDLCFRSAARA
jgi:hypothetical protein